MYLGRGIAAILIAVVATVMMRVATRRIAALHCLLRRGHAKTVESIRRESDDQCGRENALSWAQKKHAISPVISTSRKGMSDGRNNAVN
jgi:hypothetical protein